MILNANKLQALFSNKHTVVVGVGNEQCGDDGAGSLLAQRLIDFGVPDVIDGADVPENFTGDVKARTPQVILFVDVVDFGGQAGEVIVVKADQLSHERFSSHRPSLGLVANYLATETKAEVLLLGIQPQNTKIGSLPSSNVAETIDSLVTLFTRLRKN
jgi:hydrogenase 3 maturation protease